jgi:hypothetical protein
VHYIPSLLVIVLPPSKEVYSFILEVEGYPAQFFALALSIGLLWLRYTRPDLERPYKAWVPVVLVRTAMALLLLAAPFVPPPPSKQHGIWYATYAVVGTSMYVQSVVMFSACLTSIVLSLGLYIGTYGLWLFHVGEVITSKKQWRSWMMAPLSQSSYMFMSAENGEMLLLHDYSGLSGFAAYKAIIEAADHFRKRDYTSQQCSLVRHPINCFSDNHIPTDRPHAS